MIYFYKKQQGEENIFGLTFLVSGWPYLILPDIAWMFYVSARQTVLCKKYFSKCFWVPLQLVNKIFSGVISSQNSTSLNDSVPFVALTSPWLDSLSVLGFNYSPGLQFLRMPFIHSTFTEMMILHLLHSSSSLGWVRDLSNKIHQPYSNQHHQD